MLNKVQAVALPLQSKLHPRIKTGDFLDCYAVKSDLPPREAAEIIVAFPYWARALVALRGVITLPFGLKQQGVESDDMLGIFPVESDNPTEVIAGFNDKHLNFRVSTCSHDGRIYLATWVHRHNLLGRIYLATILPFHILIARNALKRVAMSTP